MAIEPYSGAVRAMMGGPGFESHKYNLATHYPGRQTGSSFKTFVLLTALENGYVPNDRIAGGGEFANPGGTPNPYEISGSGGTLRSITLASSNGAYVRLGQIVGLDRVVATARRAGITVPLDPGVISMPLGVFDVPPFEMAAAYAPIAYGGIRQEPYFVQRIEDSQGNLVLENEPNTTRAFSRQTACLATEILEGNTTGGTGTAARIANQTVAGKTGTTEDFSDAWFVGFSPYLVTAVWMGAPAERVPMSNVGGIRVMGGTYPARIFRAFMEPYHAEREPIAFPECEPTRPGQFVKLGNENEEGEESEEGEGDGDTPPGNEAPPPEEEPEEEPGDGGGGGEPTTTTTTEAPTPTTTEPPPTSSTTSTPTSSTSTSTPTSSSSTSTPPEG